MIKRSVLLAVAVLGVAVACEDDISVDCFSCRCDPAYCRTSSRFEDLTKKSNVLNNFALAHNKRDMTHYDALLDDNFTFSYDQSAIAGPPETIQWDRGVDVAATQGLLSGTDKIDFALDLEGLKWAEVPAGDETWYETTVFYHYTVKNGDTTYIPLAGSKMSFTVRNVGTSDGPHWQLVALRDIGAPTLQRTSGSRAASTEPTTYGQVKAMFRK
jgi:hypothetical protein